MRVTRAQKAATRAALVKAGLELFAEQGFTETTLDQIAAAAGVARATFYNYFKTKEDLALAALDAIFAHVRSEQEEMEPLPHSPRDRILSLYRLLVRRAAVRPELIWVWCVESIKRGPGLNAAAAFQSMLVALLAAGQRDGEVRAGYSPEDMAVDLGGITFAQIASWYRDGAPPDLEDRLCRSVSAYLDGVCRSPSRSPSKETSLR